jgi:hypothetical protein
MASLNSVYILTGLVLIRYLINYIIVGKCFYTVCNVKTFDYTSYNSANRNLTAADDIHGSIFDVF